MLFTFKGIYISLNVSLNAFTDVHTIYKSY